MTNNPRFHATPREALGEMIRETVIIAGHPIEFYRPVSLDKLFDHPAVRAAYAADEYIPYWTDLWPVAKVLAEVVLEEPWQNPQSLRALEIGCGLGITGIAALICGLQVTFSDVDSMAVQVAESNAILNGFRDFETDTIDIRSSHDREYDVILGADVMYELRMTEPLIEFLQDCLKPGGLALIADPGRESAKAFKSLLEREGFDVVKTEFDMVEGEEIKTGYLYRIRN